MSKSPLELSQVYVDVFQKRVHQLIAEGYHRMDTSAFARAEEPAITGELVREIREFIEADSSAPGWTAGSDLTGTRTLGLAGLQQAHPAPQTISAT